MIRPERIGLEPHDDARATTGCRGSSSARSSSAALHEVHIRVLGGELLKATVSNDGKPLGFELERGTAVSLHLPPDGLRVLAPSQAPPSAEDAAERPDLTAPSM